MKKSTKILLSATVLLLLVNEGRQFLGLGGNHLDTANLMQGLSISTEAKYLVSEYWASTGALPCKAGELDFGLSPGYGRSVLSAIDVTDCGQITLVYNEDSGMPGRRMVLQVEEIKGAQGLELAWSCWTPDFPDIESRLPRCRYEDRQLAEVKIPEPVEEEPDAGDRSGSRASVVAAVDGKPACSAKAAIYRPVFTDGINQGSPLNQVTSYGPGREDLVFFTEVIGAAGREIDHRWFYDNILIGDYAVEPESDRWPSWSQQSLNGLEIGTLRVEVYDDACLIGQATLQSGSEEVAESIEVSGFMPPKMALEKTLAKPRIDYASGAHRNPYVDDLTDNGDTLLLAAIRSGDTAEALKLINRLKSPEPPPRMMMREANAFMGRYARRADPFLRDAKGVSPIELAHQRGQDQIVEALIQSAISADTVVRRRTPRVVRFNDSVIDTLMANEGGFTRFDDGDTPLHRAVRTNNERAVMTMLRLSGWYEQTDAYNPPVDIYAYDANGRQAMTIARQEGFYAIERFLSLAMTRKAPGWAVSRATFATHMKDSEPGDCRDTAFADEERLYFFTELSVMDGTRIAHEWRFDRKPVHQTDFEVAGRHWSGHSSRDFSAADVGQWDVRIVTEAGEVLRTEILHYRAVTDDNRRNRQRFLGPCNLGASALYPLVRAQAPVSYLEYQLANGTVLKPGSSLEKALVSQAIVDGNIRLVGWFLERGLDINAYLKGAASPLLLAVKNDRAAMALYLITRGADVQFKRNSDGLSALQIAVTGQNTELATILLEHGADPNTRSDRGYTALHGAVRRCDVPTTLALLEHGADPDLQNDMGETPRDSLAQCDSRESWDAELPELASLYPG